MSKRIMPIFIISCLLTSLMVFKFQAIDTRSLINGCSVCHNSVTAYCSGLAYEDDDASHKYNTILGFGGNTCIYIEIYHNTIEYCDSVPSHSGSGDVILAGEEGHTYDDLGKNACGRSDYEPCSVGSEAYSS